MTAFNKTTDLPASVDTIEKLACWLGLLLTDLHGNIQFTEATDRDERIGQSFIFQVPNPPAGLPDATWRHVLRISIPIDSDWIRPGAGNLWLNAQEISTTAIPTEYKS